MRKGHSLAHAADLLGIPRGSRAYYGDRLIHVARMALRARRTDGPPAREGCCVTPLMAARCKKIPRVVRAFPPASGLGPVPRSNERASRQPSTGPVSSPASSRGNGTGGSVEEVARRERPPTPRPRSDSEGRTHP
jgi:hypothetical protein